MQKLAVMQYKVICPKNIYCKNYHTKYFGLEIFTIYGNTDYYMFMDRVAAKEQEPCEFFVANCTLATPGLSKSIRVSVTVRLSGLPC